MKEPLISIIVPVYNGEQYLNRCIDSILNQTYKNIEVLLINDGSKDNSLSVCKEYEKKDRRIRVIDKENTGVSDTRNTGIKESRGDYLMFADCDDKLYDNCCELLINNLRKYEADISIGNIIMTSTELSDTKKQNKRNSIIVFDNNKKKLYQTIYNNQLKKIKYTEGPVAKIIKKELINNNGLKFNTLLKYGEDSLFSLECYEKSNKVILTDAYVYNYITNDNSASSGKNFKYREEIFKMIKAHKEKLNELKLFVELKDDFYMFVFRQLNKIVKFERPNKNELDTLLNDSIFIELFSNLSFFKLNYKQKLKYLMYRHRIMILFTIIVYK